MVLKSRSLEFKANDNWSDYRIGTRAGAFKYCDCVEGKQWKDTHCNIKKSPTLKSIGLFL